MFIRWRKLLYYSFEPVNLVMQSASSTDEDDHASVSLVGHEFLRPSSHPATLLCCVLDVSVTLSLHLQLFGQQRLLRQRRNQRSQHLQPLQPLLASLLAPRPVQSSSAGRRRAFLNRLQLFVGHQGLVPIHLSNDARSLLQPAQPHVTQRVHRRPGRWRQRPQVWLPE